MPFIIDATIPINYESKTIEERYYYSLVVEAYNTFSIPQLYAQQVPNVRLNELKSKPISKRMAGLRRAGLIGCLNNSGITSSNYKDVIQESFSKKSSS